MRKKGVYESARELALDIAKYLKHEWEKNYLIRDVEVGEGDAATKVTVTAVFKGGVRDKVGKFGEVLDEVFRKFGEHDEIWDIAFTYK